MEHGKRCPLSRRDPFPLQQQLQLSVVPKGPLFTWHKIFSPKLSTTILLQNGSAIKITIENQFS